MSGIFISYRRSGASAVTYRLVDELKRTFGEQPIFLDVESIEPGLPFSESIQKALAKCTIVLVIIGPKWLSMSNESGERRIDDPDDWIRQEVRMALASKVRIIPVLVQGCQMPEKHELPTDMIGLAGLQAFSISNSQTHWAFDIGRLIAKLRDIDPRLPVLQTDEMKAAIPLFSRKVISAWVILVLIEMVALTEGWADSDEILGAILLLFGALALGIFGFQDIRSGKSKGRLSALAVILVSGLAIIGHGVTYSLYDEFEGPGFTSFPEPQPDPNPNPNVVNIPNTNAGQNRAAQQQSTQTITGTWVTQEGVSYNIVQTGTNITFNEFNVFGKQVGQGNGSLTGRQIQFQYYNSFIGMNTNGVADIGDGVMTFTLRNPATGQPFSYLVYRQ